MSMEDSVTLLSASEAYEQTKTNIKNIPTAELAEIMKKINEAVANKKFYIKGHDRLQIETRDRLYELGYTVSYSDYKGDGQFFWIIGWDL